MTDIISSDRSRIDRGYRFGVLRTRAGRLSVIVGMRRAIATFVLVAAAAAVAVVSLGSGDFVVPIPDVIATVLGGGTRKTQLVVLDWRMPRVLLALALGAALGAAGAIFQSLTRNPLGSPDIIGFDSGAYAGALMVMTTAGTGYLAVAAGSLAGGLATALLVYALAYRRGFHGFRLIIVGIAISAMLASLNTWIILNADLELALSASAWGSGSLNTVAWAQALPATVIILALGVVAGLLSRGMHTLEVGDEASTALGLRGGRVRLELVVVGVGFTATATATAGPIAFVSLAAPQLARRLTRSAGVSLSASAAMGALLLVSSDFVAQRLFAPAQLPAGVITVCLGGAYLIWLLIMEAKRRP
ncbi:iron chelate uptake ABC transporter family permease subunit [Plantibacter sp. M259]|uniref:FecCD family ABC transporter permease n=1 Tax=Plantibacter sp. M259 TaxID=2583822 RepID=UPI001F0EF7DB|nr:iron chelate uptake ABC transporter family permease subunit [Plantibacter sp. M259]